VRARVCARGWGPGASHLVRSCVRVRACWALQEQASTEVSSKAHHAPSGTDATTDADECIGPVIAQRSHGHTRCEGWRASTEPSEGTNAKAHALRVATCARGLRTRRGPCRACCTFVWCIEAVRCVSGGPRGAFRARAQRRLRCMAAAGCASHRGCALAARQVRRCVPSVLGLNEPCTAVSSIRLAVRPRAPAVPGSERPSGGSSGASRVQATRSKLCTCVCSVNPRC
jgi:hypothetical protein